MAGFITVGILPDQACNVALVTACGLRRRGEKRIEFGFKFFGPANHAHISIDVMGHVERILPAIGFRKMVVHFPGFKRA